MTFAQVRKGALYGKAHSAILKPPKLCFSVEAAGHHPVRELRDVARPVDVVLHGPEQQCLRFKVASVFYWHPVSTEMRILLIPHVRLGATYLLGC